MRKLNNVDRTHLALIYSATKNVFVDKRRFLTVFRGGHWTDTEPSTPATYDLHVQSVQGASPGPLDADLSGVDARHVDVGRFPGVVDVRVGQKLFGLRRSSPVHDSLDPDVVVRVRLWKWIWEPNELI